MFIVSNSFNEQTLFFASILLAIVIFDATVPFTEDFETLAWKYIQRRILSQRYSKPCFILHLKKFCDRSILNFQQFSENDLFKLFIDYLKQAEREK